MLMPVLAACHLICVSLIFCTVCLCMFVVKVLSLSLCLIAPKTRVSGLPSFEDGIILYVHSFLIQYRRVTDRIAVAISVAARCKNEAVWDIRIKNSGNY